MNEALKLKSMNALKKFAVCKNLCDEPSKNLSYNKNEIYGTLYEGFQDKRVFKDKAQYTIYWTEKKANIYFFNIQFADMENKSVFASDEFPFECNDNRLEFSAGGSHWTLE